MTDASPDSTLSFLTGAQSARLRRIRQFKETLARGGIMLGGIGVIGAVALIFFYLLYEVAPLVAPAHAERSQAWTLEEPARGPVLFQAIEEQNEVGFRLLADGRAVFFEAKTGRVIQTTRIPHADVARPVVAAAASAAGDLLAVGFDDGHVVVMHETYSARYDADGRREIDAAVDYPYGEAPMRVFDGKPVAQLAVAGGSTLTLAARAPDGEVVARAIKTRENLMTGETTVEEQDHPGITLAGDVGNLWLARDGSNLYAVFRDGRIVAYTTNDLPGRTSEATLPQGRKISASTLLLGNLSLLAGDDRGAIHQYFLVRDEQNQYNLRYVRTLPFSDSPIRAIRAEQRRKSFVVADEAGRIGLLNATSEKLSLTIVPDRNGTNAGGVDDIVMAPRGDGLLVFSGDAAVRYRIENEHPDVSMKALWGRIWYEGYEDDKYIWQSSAATADFEPKYSLVPLVFGTLKAAIFAMLVAVPLALCGAVYTAYFMAPGLRRMVKPTIELMEALPTVILGFLAGLWLAPMVEGALPGIFAMMLITPVFILAAAWGWSRLPDSVRHRVPAGYEPLLLIPVIVLAVALPMSASDWMEAVFFGGDTRLWLRETLGIPFDQRNALIIGLAMGFAVIPTIFSIAEDALFEVPKHLTQGSLALGATPWQTLVRVIIPTASPGIFSALMMGFGRAVGETMIVLMATGNTAVMTMNLFEGLRTLSANIAVEMPESEVGSSHFRILFLAALVLFLFTFLVNTTAELVRQRLRRKYGSL